MMLAHNLIVAWIAVFALSGNPLGYEPPLQSSNQQAKSSKSSPQESSEASTALPASHKPVSGKKRKMLSTSDCTLSAGTSGPNGSTKPSKPCPPVKVVVRNGGASEHTLHLSGGVNDAATDSHRGQTTDQLLQSTGRNLQQLAKRHLAPAEKEMVDQILRYSEQSRSATAAGDLELGHNFALKAHLLSDELVSH